MATRRSSPSTATTDANRRQPANTRSTGSAGVDRQDRLGEGGELHQGAVRGGPVLTTQQGVPVADDQNSLRVGERGPTLLEDFHFREKIFHFDHERIPERVVHARGYGAHGYFETYESLADLTRADLFQRAGRADRRRSSGSRPSPATRARPTSPATCAASRSSSTPRRATGTSSATTSRCSSSRTRSSSPTSIHAVKQEPDRGFPQAQSAHDNFWDFVSLMPEVDAHGACGSMSDRAIPRSFRFMEGFGVHTFRFVNADGKSTFVKFHWKPKLGPAVGGVERGGEDQRRRPRLPPPRPLGRDPDRRLPGVGARRAGVRRRVRRRVRLRRPRRHQAHPRGAGAGPPRRAAGARPRASTTSSPRPSRSRSAPRTSCPGIDFTNDPLLQGRNFSYLDTQLKRLGGPNFTHLPVNAPKCPFAHFQQDGHMAMVNPVGPGRTTSRTRGPAPSGARARIPSAASRRSRRAERATSAGSAPETLRRPLQPGPPVLRQPDPDRAGSTSSTRFVFELSARCETPGDPRADGRQPAQRRRGVGGRRSPTGSASARCRRPAAAGRRDRSTDLPPSPALSILSNGPSTFAGRKLGVLVTDGTDGADARRAAQGRSRPRARRVELVAPKIGGVTLSDGTARRRPEGRRRPVGALRRRGAGRLRRGRGAARRSARGPRLRRRRLRPPQVRRPCRGRRPLLAAAGRRPTRVRRPPSHDDAEAFLKACRSLRYWDR